MADGFTFEIVSPEKLLLSAQAELVTIPGVEGDMGIMDNHAPVMTSLRPGVVSAKLADGTDLSFFVRGGFADVTPTSLTVLAEFAVPQAELTRELFEEQRAHATQALEMADDELAEVNARSLLEQLNHLEPTLLPA